MAPATALWKRDGVLSAISQSSAVRETATVAKKLALSTGKAAWIAGTTFLVMGVPLLILLDREAQLNDMELQQQALLGGGAPPALAQ